MSSAAMIAIASTATNPYTRYTRRRRLGGRALATPATPGFTSGVTFASPLASSIASNIAPGQQVSGTPDRLQDLRVAAVVAELGAQARDMDIDRPVEAELGRPLGEIEQLLAGQDAPRALRERAQDRELVRRDLDGIAIERDRHLLRIEDEPADLHGLLRRAGLAAHAAHGRPDPGQELARRERLGHVVVGADLEAEHAIGFLGARRDHDDRHVGPRPELARDFNAVAPGQHDVEHDAVVLPAQRLGLALGAGRRDRHQHAVRLEVAGGQLREPLVVFDQQDLDRGHRGIAHGNNLTMVSNGWVRSTHFATSPRYFATLFTWL